MRDTVRRSAVVVPSVPSRGCDMGMHPQQKMLEALAGIAHAAELEPRSTTVEGAPQSVGGGGSVFGPL